MRDASVKRFWERVDKSGECWVWTGACGPTGHGVAWTGERTMIAHRMAWLLTTGSLPKDCLLHRCDNPPCVNPAHLFEGSRADNMRDMWTKGRGVKPPHPRGERHHSTPLTAEDVVFIRWARGRGHSLPKLGRLFGVSANAIRNIAIGKTWTHL